MRWISKWRHDRQLRATVDAWIDDAQHRALIRDVEAALVGVSALGAAAAAAAALGDHDAVRQLEAFVAPLSDLAAALEGRRWK